mmetsp:Transcript_11395/g.16568  ORF Transcript_11395/g.16568 Transcript_11395/m.16568 type:complete len:128 (+) Transcript_11395:1440-1823(+)
MLLTVQQTTMFFEDADHIGLSARTRSAFSAEGVEVVMDLGDCEDEDWDERAKICRKPNQIEDPANPGNMINQSPFTLYVNSLKRLKIAAALVRYYESVVIELTVSNICWPVLKRFEVQMKAFKERKK